MVGTPHQEPRSRTFEVIASDLEQYGRLLCDVIERVLAPDGISYHSINYRVKTKQSATKKVFSKPDRYKQPSDLKDLLGLRIITYFSDDVDRIAEILTTEFEVDEQNSVDKRAIQDPDRFGYASLHYVLSLSKGRSEMREYSKFAGQQFEIQIRSILQHAWAEIEHDLGYKTRAAVPRQIRRRFSRLAGLLELADDEFKALRDELEEYEEAVGEASGDELRDLEIDMSTLNTYIYKSPVCQILDSYIAQAFGNELTDSVAFASTLIDAIKAFDIRTIADLDDRLKVNAPEIASLAYQWIHSPDLEDEYPSEETDRGICLFYFWFYLLVNTTEQRRRAALERTWPGEGQSMSRGLSASWRRAQANRVDLSAFGHKPEG